MQNQALYVILLFLVFCKAVMDPLGGLVGEDSASPILHSLHSLYGVCTEYLLGPLDALIRQTTHHGNRRKKKTMRNAGC